MWPLEAEICERSLVQKNVQVTPKGCKVYRVCRNVDIRLPGKGNSNFHGARPVHSNHLDD